jgi:hypothetical protein
MEESEVGGYIKNEVLKMTTSKKKNKMKISSILILMNS